MANIVLFGGGTGLSTVLKGLKGKPYSITAVVAVTDNGGSSGVLRKDLGVPALGDLRSCIVALADQENPFTKLLSFRFTEGELKGVSLGNLILAASIKTEGSLAGAAERICRLSNARGVVLPAAEGTIDIVAELEDGSVVKGEQEIATRENRSKIKRLFLDPPATAPAKVLEAIHSADFVVIAPGGLSTSIVPILLAGRVKEALAGKKMVYLANIVTRPGDTDGFALSDHCKEIELYTGKKPDIVLANNGTPEKDVLDFYREFGSELVKIDSANGSTIIMKDLVDKTPLGEAQKRERVLGKGMRDWPHLIRHDPAATAAALQEVVG